ncbi:hypothetical protein KST80_07855 [Fusobacterium polymorphum]|uniref:Uncharacterized protein n=1 Tax=Fusobacterium nucleatum subsp. polymorphum TaxID=76857 RepID=A0A2C6BGT4_FUSNP|nr:hypothetical protein [Fusobacterium polymorphum]PHI03777.1 hypothetical protein CBG54_12330 [Fusobacterium polymorphum]PHI12327.1 hypothetical protein CBG59_00180 [Fusobacterium polymorphum]PHI16139.1 hypothetical protein CBG58_03370 [Fusobacterium polymorphum]
MEKEKKLYEALDLGKDCIVVPRQAIGKLSDNDILGPIFSILPLFYEEDRKDTIVLTLKDMINHLLITDNLFLKNIVDINNTHLYYIQILRNDTFKITIQRENMNKFLKEVNRLKYVVIKKEQGTYLEDKNLSFGATGLLKFLLENEELKNIETHFDFSRRLSHSSFIKKEKIKTTKKYLKELEKNNYYYLFDIIDRKQIEKGIEYQVVTVSNYVISPKEAKKYLGLSDEKIVSIYPMGEVK